MLTEILPHIIKVLNRISIKLFPGFFTHNPRQPLQKIIKTYHRRDHNCEGLITGCANPSYSEQDKALWRVEFSITVSIKVASS